MRVVHTVGGNVVVGVGGGVGGGVGAGVVGAGAPGDGDGSEVLGTYIKKKGNDS